MMIFPRRFKLNNIKDICRIIDEQKDNENIFITKYGDDEKVSTVILDFDGADYKDEVYKEVRKIHYFLKNRGLNSVIVSSTNKGFHFYIQIPTICFDYDHLGLDRTERNKLFVMFTKNLIKANDFKLKTLDETNTNAGLGGNIRLLGSCHPKTHQKVDIVLGEFIEADDDYYERCSHYVNMIYKSSINQYFISEEHKEKELIKRKKKWKGVEWDYDPVEENDLRDLLPSLYGGKVKKYGSYIFMQCPWHADRKPSMKVTKRWYYCLGCGEKGNIWTLIKKGEIRL